MDSSMFPIYEELVEESEEVRSNDGIELRTIENRGVCGDVEWKIQEDISKEFDCGVGDGDELYGAGN